jgi:hypothetical protein
VAHLAGIGLDHQAPLIVNGQALGALYPQPDPDLRDRSGRPWQQGRCRRQERNV